MTSRGLSRRGFLRNAAMGAAALAVPRRAPAVPERAPKPNFVVMLSDDMGWGQPGFQGGKDVPTPHLDRLAREGVQLTQFYVQPVCSPTRACLLTGRYAWKNGMEVRPTATSAHGMLLDERTLAQALKDAGYWTAMVGKWHLGEWHKEHLPLQRGFDHHYGHYSALIDSFTHLRGPVLDWHRNGKPVVEKGYSSYLLADEAAKLIRQHDGSRPFFLYVPFNAVHGPHQAPQEVLAKYKGKGRKARQLAQLECMDTAIGRILDAVDKKGIRDNTLVFFFNDNGGPGGIGNRPYRGGKSAYHEGGIRVAALMRWPGKLKAGTKNDEPLHVIDIYPTFVKLAGGSLKQKLPLDGKDIWPTLTEGKPSPHDEIVYSLHCIRRGDWKYIAKEARYYNWRAGQTQLYNIREDPYEKKNLAAKRPEIVTQLQKRLKFHATQARQGEQIRRIPNFPPAVYGEEENRLYGEKLKASHGPSLRKGRAGRE